MKVVKIIEDKKGGAKVVVDITEKEKTKLKEIYGKNRFHTNLIKRAIVDGLKLMKKEEK